ncbi:MucR family transcriptional regulator [Enterovirga sp. CN4-39]
MPSGYPMVAPNYAKHRSELAKALGLGRKREPEPVKPKRGGRQKAA